MVLALAALVLTGSGLGATVDPADASFPGQNGKIAFASDRVTTGNPEGDYEIFTMDSDGTDVKQLTANTAIDLSPAWSADGKQIAFASDRDGNVEVYTMNADGTNQVNRSNNGARDFKPAWSPDGKKLAFSSSRDGNDDEIYTMAANGTNPTNRTANGVTDFGPDWQPKRR